MRAEADLADATAVAEGIRKGRTLASDVMKSALRAIRDVNPELNAFVYTGNADELVEAACEIDRRIARGDCPEPFAGVPIGVKDLEDVRGMPTTNGTLLVEDLPAPDDSYLVARLRAAGAIPIGKTNTPEFGYSLDTRNRRFGQTKNPRDPARSPGGSSGGSAAAVAAGIVPLATGSDGGGSIRIPAAFCGLPGLKPTTGMIPSDADTWAGLSVPGSLTRSVRDVARFLDVVALRKRTPSFEAVIAEPLRLSELRALASLDLDGAMFVEESVRSAFLGALDRLQAAGMRVMMVESPLPESRDAFTMIASYGDARHLEKVRNNEREKLSRGFLAWCERGSGVTPGELAAAKADRASLTTAVDLLLGDADLILSPTIGMEPWQLGFRWDRDPLEVLLTYPFNLTGHPAITIPLPGILSGLQAVGPPNRDDLLLRFAAAAMDALGEGNDPR